MTAATIVSHMTWTQVIVGVVWFSILVMFWMLLFEALKALWRRWRRS